MRLSSPARRSGNKAYVLLAFLAVSALECAGCGQRPGGSASPSGPPASGGVSATGKPAAPHVFVLVMENRSFAQAVAQPYTAQLAGRFAVATDYHAVAHPSLPNYLA